jgi:hypothetical protein
MTGDAGQAQGPLRLDASGRASTSAGVSPGWRVAALAAGMAGGAVLAWAPAFSGLALLTVLVVGAGVGAVVLAVPGTTTVRPAGAMLLAWSLWAVALVLVEAFVLAAGDDLRWPTFSAVQDPLTTAEPLGRFAAGFLWTVAGLGLVAISRRWGGRAEPGRAALVGVPLLALALSTIPDGPMLDPRDAPTIQAPGIDTTAVARWPVTAWWTIAVFAGLGLAVLALQVVGRRARPPGAVPDLLGWLMAPLPGRVLGVAAWLWCGWHFLAR